MEEKLKILRRYFSNKYSRNDYFELKRLILSEDSEIESLFKTHWNEFKTEENGALKDLSEVLTNLNQKIDEKSNDSVVKKIFIAYSRIAAILVIPLFLALGFLYFQFNQYLFQKNVFVDVVSPAGSRTSLNLPDGSMVWLNGDSHIRYPAVFGENREVKIEGEAFFKVKSDKKHPFLVVAKDIIVRATGTAFNVSAYPDDDAVETTLVEGKVILYERKSNSEIKALTPGECLKFDAQKNSYSIETGNTLKYTAWKDGLLVFKNDHVEDIAKKLARWFNIDVEIANEKIKQYPFTATFTDETLPQVLELLSLATPVTYQLTLSKKLPDGSFSKQKVQIGLKTKKIKR